MNIEELKNQVKVAQANLNILALHVTNLSYSPESNDKPYNRVFDVAWFYDNQAQTDLLIAKYNLRMFEDEPSDYKKGKL